MSIQNVVSQPRRWFISTVVGFSLLCVAAAAVLPAIDSNIADNNAIELADGNQWGSGNG